MAAPKCRIDVWQPTILNVTTTGATTTAQRPPMWVKCDTVTDVTTENPPGPNPNLRRANACTSVEIKDEMFSPRIAYISIANRPQDFTAFDDDTMETQHQDSDGNEIQISSSDVKTRIRRNWGPFSYFFKEFQQIRIVDLETHLVLFTGRIYKVSKKHDGQRGATVELVCKDALEELKNFSMKTMPKELHFPADTERSTVVQALLNLGFNYENSLPAGGANKNQTSPVTTVLSSATLAINSNDAAASAGANSYSRFELSATAPDTVTKVKTRKTGSKHLLSELTRWAILEPHEDETAENQFGYDFFVDSNIGSNNLLATTAPPPAMFNYFKRGNRLSSAGGAGQDADTYGLTCILPTVARAAHTGLQQRNVGTTAASGNTTIDYFAVNANHSLYPGQLITIGSETMYVKFVANSNDEGGEEEVYVVRGWGGSTPASFSSNAAIVENRPATAVMQKDTSSFEDAKDELFTECSLTYDTSYFIGTKKFGTKEKTKKFEIMFASEIAYGDTPNNTSTFAWAGLDFDDDSAPADADTPGTDSAEFVSAYREDGTTLIGATVGRIQYQSTSTITGATNFGYVMLSDITANFPKNNAVVSGTSQNYVVLKGHTSNATCRVNCNATEVQQGRPSLAFAGGTTELKRGFSMTKETHDNIDDIRQEIAARLGQSTIAMKRGDFLVSKAPYYWADFKVRSVSADGSTGQILTVKSDNGTAAVKVTNYGFREGMLTHKRDDADGNPDYRYIATANGNDVYGYCYSMTADDTFRVNLTESQSFAVDDKIRLFIPVRAGEPMFVDHILATVYGEHLTTAVNFNEMPAPTTSYSTIGENEPRIRMRVGSVNRQNIWNTIAVDRLEASERERPNLPKGTQTFSFGGTWSYPANNIVQWTAGDLRTSDGEVYQVAASNTSATTYGLGSSGMTGSNEYTVYLDPEGENPSGNTYHLYTVISTSYLEDDDNIVVLKTSVGAIAGKANAIGGPNMDLSKTDTPKWEAFKFAHDESVTADLVKAATLTGNKLVNNTITATQIGDNQISTAKIQANAITANEIVTNAVTSNKIVAGSIVADKIATNAITATKIEADAVTAVKIEANALNSHVITLVGGGRLVSATGTTRNSTNQYLSAGSGILLDRYGLIGATGTGSSNVEFYLSATDGKGHFGGGTCTISKAGIFFPEDVESVGSLQWAHTNGGGQVAFYKKANANNLFLTTWGSSSSASDNAFLLINTWLGNASFKVPAGYFDALTTDSFTINDSTMSLGGNTFSAGDVLLLTNGSSTDAQSLHTHGNLGGGGVALGDSPTWTGTHTFNGDVNINADIDIGNSSTDIADVYATLRVHNHSALFQNGTSSTPGIQLLGDGSAISGIFMETGSTNRIRFPTKGGTGAYFYQSSSSGNGVSAGTGNFTSLYASGTIALSGTSTFTGRVNLDYVTYSSASITQSGGTTFNGGSVTASTAAFKLTGLATSGTATNYVAIQSNGTLVKFSSSSERYKKNIRDLEIDSTQIYNLVPKSFEYKSDDTTSFGYIAETVDTMLPSIVMRQEDGTPESINYAHINILLVEELKKLKARIEVLEGN